MNFWTKMKLWLNRWDNNHKYSKMWLQILTRLDICEVKWSGYLLDIDISIVYKSHKEYCNSQ